MRIGFGCYVAKNTPSYRRRPVSGGFNRGGGIPAFAGMTKKIYGMTGKIYGMTAVIVALFIAMPAYADDVADRKTVTSRKYVDDQIATKQPILNASEADLRNNVVMYTNQAGTVAAKPISATLSGNGIDDNLPTVGAVNTGLATKQDELSGTSGNVVTYTSSAGTLGEHAVYKTTTTYDTTNAGALVEANHANSAIAKGLNEHLTCAPNGIDPVSNNCWLWQINDQAAGTVYTDHQ